jgi:23S rRNA pseudouridine955/2504/2580 synthase
MVKDREKNQVSFSEKPVRGSLPAETRFERLKTLTKNGITFSLVKILLVTGRSHQIRVHFQAAGHPLLGEKKYGSEESISASEKLHIRRQMLHAFRLGFPEMEGNLSNLSGKVMEAPLPEDFRKVMGIRR